MTRVTGFASEAPTRAKEACAHILYTARGCLAVRNGHLDFSFSRPPRRLPLDASFYQFSRLYRRRFLAVVAGLCRNGTRLGCTRSTGVER